MSSKNILSKIKVASFIIILSISFFGFSENAKASTYSYGYGKEGSNCIFWNITLDKTIYVPGENIKVDGSASNNGCAYDSAWTLIKQTVHNVGLDALSSTGDIGTQYVSIPSNISTGTHNLVVNTYYEHHNYLYTDTKAPDYSCGCGFRSQSCTGSNWWDVCWPSNWQCDTCPGARIAHVVVGEVWGEGGDIKRTIPFTVVKPEVTFTASDGMDIDNPLEPRSTTTISWTSKNINTMDITVNGKSWKASYTAPILTSVNHPAVYSEPVCFKTCSTPVLITAAYTSNELVDTFIPWLSGSTSTNPLIGGDNVIVFSGYVTGRTEPVIIKTIHVYVNTNIIINISSDKSIVSAGTQAKLTWSTTKADSCSLVRNGSAWIADSSTATSGKSVSTGSLFATTTFTVFCINKDPDGSVVNSAEKSIEIGVKPGVKPSMKLDVVENDIIWDVVGEVDSCSVVDTTAKQTISNELNGSENYLAMTSDSVIELSCNTPAFGVLSLSSKSINPTIGPSCKITQNGQSVNFYKDRKTIFEMPANGVTLTDVKWTFINSKTTTLSGNPVSKTFTTVGSTTIKARGKIVTADGASYVSCTGFVRFKVDPGSGSEQ